MTSCATQYVCLSLFLHFAQWIAYADNNIHLYININNILFVFFFVFFLLFCIFYTCILKYLQRNKNSLRSNHCSNIFFVVNVVVYKSKKCLKLFFSFLSSILYLKLKSFIILQNYLIIQFTYSTILSFSTTRNVSC